VLPDRSRSRIGAAIAAAVRYLRKVQRADGSWVPLWFGNQDHAAEENPVYGTSRVLAGLAEVDAAGVGEMIERGVAFLLKAQRDDGGWGEGDGSIEETALAVTALSACGAAPDAQKRGRASLKRMMDRGAEAAPIGFYFAKLWYFERLYPLIFATGALPK
jgi:squalene-hopene/tetraprenyl-beta-curcumene cyclase